MRCPRCQHENPAGVKFCGECGTPFQRLAESIQPLPAYADVQRSLTEALEQQAATSDVLRVISESQTDVQPVFDALIDSATRLCLADIGAITRFDGEVLRLVLHSGMSAEVRAFWQEHPIRPGRESVTGRAALERRTIHVPDILADPSYDYTSPDSAFQQGQAVTGYRATLVAPMLREDTLIGTIAMMRREAQPFSASQIKLLETFADQAVIAIENVRLFKELEARNRDLTESLEQQTATSEILRVISQSPTDVQPVFDTIVRSGARLCNAVHATVVLTDGTMMDVPANYGSSSPENLAAARALWPRPLDMTTAAGTAILTRSVVHIPDSEDPSATEFVRRAGRLLGYRSSLAVPMLRGVDAIGAIRVARPEPNRFSDAAVELLKTFADQAVIAIENVRLFKELEARNSELRVTLEQQTATSELLKVIGRSTFDLQPVFETLIENAVRLCGAEHGVIRRFDGERLRAAAQYNTSPELEAYVQENPVAPERGSAAGRAALERRTVHIEDALSDPEYTFGVQHLVAPIRTALAIPMVRAGELLGVITIHRHEARAFDDSQIGLMETFADQAAIAIENVRLFKELQARTGELTQSVEQLTALGEVSRAVTSTLDVETVLETVVARARQLAGADGCLIYEYDEGTQQFHSRATDNLDAAYAEALRGAPIRKGEGVSGRAAEMREPVQVADITQPSAYQSSVRDITIQAGYRAVLSVPLLREDEIIGSLILIRKTPGEFPPEIVELLKTFATQSALAIQNARLFREIEDKGRELELASKHKSQFLANMSHELRTPLNAILGYTELILDGIYGDISEKARETMGRIERSGRHLLALINDVLDLSKIEAGQLTLSLADYSLGEIVNTVVTAMEPLAAEKGLALRVALDPGLPLARGDDRRLSQVLLNLVGNAVKFTDAGEVRIAGKASDGAFLVSVSDTGPGIAAEDQARIFDEFQQVDTSNTRKKGGTGLGLSIARRILALHGGRIWV